MINPIDHQLSYWKVEKNAETNKDPSSSARQELEGQTSVKEAERRDTSVQSGDESRESQRSGVGERDARRHRQRSINRDKAEPEEKTTEDKEGFDLYA